VAVGDDIEGVAGELEEGLLAFADFELFGGGQIDFADADNFSVRYPFSSVIWIVLRFQSTFLALAELPDVHTSDAVFALPIPIFLIRCQTRCSNILDFGL